MSWRGLPGVGVGQPLLDQPLDGVVDQAAQARGQALRAARLRRLAQRMGDQ
jgi:hypothetical protein